MKFPFLFKQSEHYEIDSGSNTLDLLKILLGRLLKCRFLSPSKTSSVRISESQAKNLYFNEI